MNRSLVHCIVDCLRLDGPSDVHLDRLAGFEEREWKGTLPWLDDSGLALYFVQRLKELRAEDRLPTEIASRLERNLDANRLRVAKMANEFDALNRRFERARVPYAVLKGFALVPEYCPDATLRHQKDYDFVVKRQYCEQAQELIQDAGYPVKKIAGPPDHPLQILFGPRMLRWPSPQDDFYSVLDPREVELHFELWESDRDQVELAAPEDFLERVVLRSWQGIDFPALREDDGLVHQVLHAFYHVIGYWCRPSCLFEIARFLHHRSSDEVLWTSFQERIKNRGRLADIANLVFMLAVRVFGGHIPIGSRAAGCQSRSLSLWVERYGLDWILESFPGSKLTLFLYQELVQDQAAWPKLLRRQLFPLHRALVAAETPVWLPSLNEMRWERWLHLARKLEFHISEMIRYGMEYPHWRRALSQNLRERISR